MRRVGFWIGIVVILSVILFPIIWVYLTSFKTPDDILTTPPKLVFSPTFYNYEYIVSVRPSSLG